MIYFYYGDDSFRVRETVMQLKNKFVELYDRSGHNTTILDVSDFTLESFFNAVKAQGFLASKKCSIVKNIFSHKKFADIQDPIIAYLKTQQNTKDENYIIFWQEGVPRRNLKLFKYLVDRCTPLKCCTELTPLYGRQRIAWIQSQAKNYGKTIDSEAAEVLVSLIGDDSWTLHHELHKLCHFTKTPAITVHTVRDLVHAINADVMFSLLDAISAKQKKQALTLLATYLRSDADRQKLFGMLLRQCRLMVQVKEASRETPSAAALSERLKLHPFVTKKMLQHSSSCTLQELKNLYRSLITLDLLLKERPAAFDAALALVIMKL